MASVTHNPMHLVQQVEQAIQREADRLREDMIAQAVKDFEAQLRERIAVATMKVGEFYSYERHGTELVIKVKYDSETPLR